MRLTLIGPVFPYRGGIAHHTGLLARSLLQHSHDIQLISFKRQYPAWLYPGKSDREPGQPPVKITALYSLDPIYPWTWARTFKAIEDYQPQATIIQWWTTFWAPAFSKLAKNLQKANIPIIYIIHNVMPHETKRWDRYLATMALFQGDKFIVQSFREKGRLEALLPAAQVETCSLPVFDLIQTRKLPQNTALNKLGLSPTGPVLLCFGIVRAYKGIRFAIEAIAELKKRGQRYHLLVAGEIWEDKHFYLDQIEKLGIADQITLDDRYIPNEEVINFFSAADVFLAPYTDGTQSAAIKLALGYGLPIVASDILIDDMLAQSPQVIIIKPGITTELSSAIESAKNLGVGVELSDDFVNESWSRLVRTIESMISQQEI